LLLRRPILSSTRLLLRLAPLVGALLSRCLTVVRRARLRGTEPERIRTLLSLRLAVRIGSTRLLLRLTPLIRSLLSLRLAVRIGSTRLTSRLTVRIGSTRLTSRLAVRIGSTGLALCPCWRRRLRVGLSRCLLPRGDRGIGAVGLRGRLISGGAPGGRLRCRLTLCRVHLITRSRGVVLLISSLLAPGIITTGTRGLIGRGTHRPCARLIGTVRFLTLLSPLVTRRLAVRIGSRLTLLGPLIADRLTPVVTRRLAVRIGSRLTLLTPLITDRLAVRIGSRLTLLTPLITRRLAVRIGRRLSRLALGLGPLTRRALRGIRIGLFTDWPAALAPGGTLSALTPCLSLLRSGLRGAGLGPRGPGLLLV
ncbi:MAG: hypothetical protein L0G99_09440, partial [Propionibacteriales bacterium]|nr:hypothetical protein [Propionibacteriales bacterium]